MPVEPQVDFHHLDEHEHRAEVRILSHSGPWTEQDYLALPVEGPKIELIDGSLLVSPVPSQPHQRLARRLTNLLERNAPDDIAVENELNVRVAPDCMLIPDVVVTRQQGPHLVHDPEHVLLVGEVRSPSNHGRRRLEKPGLFAAAGIPWYLLIEFDAAGTPTCTLYRLVDGGYVQHAKAACGETLEFPEPLGSIDPADLLRRRP